MVLILQRSLKIDVTANICGLNTDVNISLMTEQK